VSSICVYDPDNQNQPAENLGHVGLVHQANQGYGQAKRQGELAALNWVNLKHAVVVRPTNMYGPRDHFRPMEQAHVIPALIQRIDELTSKKPDLTAYGNPNTMREFMYVKDCARAMVHLVENSEGHEVYNIGTGGETAITITDLIQLIGKTMGRRVRPKWDRERGGGDDVRRSNVDKIRATGWKHEYDLETGLRETVDWYYKYEVTR
jgi:GDP-L-fucose synthase